METKPSVEITFNRYGLAIIRYRGQDFSDEAECRRIHDVIRKQIHEADRLLQCADLIRRATAGIEPETLDDLGGEGG